MPPLLSQGGDGRLARVHRDALRPDPPRPLQGDARDDGAEDLGRAATPSRWPTSSSRWPTWRRPSRRSRRRSASVVDSLVEDGPERLSRFRDRIEDDRTANSKRFTEFKSAVGRRSVKPWFRNDGLVLLVAGIVVFGALGGILLWQRDRRLQTVAPRWGDVLLIAFGVCALVNAVVLLAASLNRGSGGAAPAAQQEAERWEAFRRYLTDFPRLAGGAAGDARALGALPRLRDRVRDRRAGAAGRAAAHAGGARAGEHALLDRPERRPRLGPDLARDRRPRGRLRLGARAAVLRARAASAAGSPAAAAVAAAAVAAAPGEGACARTGARQLCQPPAPPGASGGAARAGVQAGRAHAQTSAHGRPGRMRVTKRRRRRKQGARARAARRRRLGRRRSRARSRPGTRPASSWSPRHRRARRGAASAAQTPTSRRSTPRWRGRISAVQIDRRRSRSAASQTAHVRPVARARERRPLPLCDRVLAGRDRRPRPDRQAAVLRLARDPGSRAARSAARATPSSGNCAARAIPSCSGRSGAATRYRLPSARPPSAGSCGASPAERS